MPELPEVQTVVNSLNPKLKNLEIIDFKLFWKNALHNIDLKNFVKKTLNKKIFDIFRFSKYIVFKLEDGFILCHLRMTGSLFLRKTAPESLKHVSAFFILSNKKYLIFEDVRKFGGFKFLPNLNKIRLKYGIDPTSKGFNLKWLEKNILSKSRQMKHLLFDQSFIAGLGNIYIDEILWKTKIHPQRLSNSLDKENLSKILTATKNILYKSIKHHGTTIKDFKYDQMRTGTYRYNLKAYGRDGQKCKRCEDKIVKIKVASRGTHLCPTCQKI